VCDSSLVTSYALLSAMSIDHCSVDSECECVLVLLVSPPPPVPGRTNMPPTAAAAAQSFSSTAG